MIWNHWYIFYGKNNIETTKLPYRPHYTDHTILVVRYKAHFPAKPPLAKSFRRWHFSLYFDSEIFGLYFGNNIFPFIWQWHFPFILALEEFCSRHHVKQKSILSRTVPTTVATTSKHIIWLFWNNLTNGNTRRGRYSVSPNTADQWVNADRILQ